MHACTHAHADTHTRTLPGRLAANLIDTIRDEYRAAYSAHPPPPPPGDYSPPTLLPPPPTLPPAGACPAPVQEPQHECVHCFSFILILFWGGGTCRWHGVTATCSHANRAPQNKPSSLTLTLTLSQIVLLKTNPPPLPPCRSPLNPSNATCSTCSAQPCLAKCPAFLPAVQSSLAGARGLPATVVGL
jgi:hypothetical protein